MSNRELFVCIEEEKEKIRPVSLELLSHARSKEKFEVCAVWIGDSIKAENKKTLLEAGANKIYQIFDKKLNGYNLKYYSSALVEFISLKKPAVVLFGATKQSRELAPYIAFKLNAGLVADCTSIEFEEREGEIKMLATRPTFGGSLMATIVCKTMPQMATVREHILKQGSYQVQNAGTVEVFNPHLKDTTSVIELLSVIKSFESKNDDMQGAEIILSGGLGLKTAENFKKLEQLAQLLGNNVAVGASRGAVDKKLTVKDRQIGQTGKTVAPKIYMAFGISGAIHHLCGVENSEFIIAVNNNKNAPIFESCDLGIVEDAVKVIDEMIEYLTTK